MNNGYRVEIKTFEGNIIRDLEKSMPTVPVNPTITEGYKVEETSDNKIPWFKRWFQK